MVFGLARSCCLLVTIACLFLCVEAQSAIDCPGLVRALCSSLLLSSTTVLNQWGFMLVVASLYDTFVVRSLIVPSLLFCFVEANWWPGRVPPPARDIDGLPISLHVN